MPIYKLVADPSDRIHWLYIASAYLIGLFVFVGSNQGASPATVIAYVKRMFPKRILLHPSAIADYKMLFANTLLYFYLFPMILIYVNAFSANAVMAFAALFRGNGPALLHNWTDRVVLTITWLFVWDFSFFIAHYLQHRISLLWEFHKVHHSAETLTPFTVYRMHPVDDVLTTVIVAFNTGLVSGIFSFVYADSVSMYTVNGLNIFWFLFLVCGYHLRHSHIWVLFPKPIRYFISSPALHLIHHSDNSKHFNKNFARIFVIWDWFAGTLYIPERKVKVRFGLGSAEHRKFDNLWDLYVLPFRNIARRCSIRRIKRV